jgi:hypothetical protein
VAISARLQTVALAAQSEGGPMAETIRAADYFYIQIPNKPGEGARAPLDEYVLSFYIPMLAKTLA